jgi:hypothetical protein
MSASKHRRKGKERPRRPVPLKVELGPEDPQDLEEDQLVEARLRDLHGEREWTADEWAEAVRQLVAEGKVRPIDR